MSKKWYCKLKRKVVGPLTNSELVKMIKSGVVKPDTQVRKDNSKWVIARSVNGLFEAAGVFTGEHRCPSCGTTIDDPPTTCPTCQRKIDASPFSGPGY